MSSYDPPAGRSSGPRAPLQPETQERRTQGPRTQEPHPQEPRPQEREVQDTGRLPGRVGTVVWGLIVLALAWVYVRLTGQRGG